MALQSCFKKGDIEFYDRKKLLRNWYKNGKVKTPFGRQIKVTENKAFNYLIQSTTADLVIERAVEIDTILQGKKSFISHIVHDEIVIDFDDEDRGILQEIKNLFAKNKLDSYIVNVQAGKNYYELKEMNI